MPLKNVIEPATVVVGGTGAIGIVVVSPNDVTVTNQFQSATSVVVGITCPNVSDIIPVTLSYCSPCAMLEMAALARALV